MQNDNSVTNTIGYNHHEYDDNDNDENNEGDGGSRAMMMMMMMMMMIIIRHFLNCHKFHQFIGQRQSIS